MSSEGFLFDLCMLDLVLRKLEIWKCQQAHATKASRRVCILSLALGLGKDQPYETK